ncbi:MAG: hypothetical protein FJ146_14470 [Deltaproteobacteria bacterium]|nr:hypothetical protein [Deltaproteobacteria bacterium]
MLRRVISLSTVIFAVCASSSGYAQGKIKIVVSVDWEGEDLRPENLRAMAQFRQHFPNVPLQHFLNAAYFTKPGVQAASVTRAIRSVLRPGDEEGLHIHAWRSLVEAAGVPFRLGPSFVDEDVKPELCAEDCGMDVALTAYKVQELRKIIRTSVTILEDQGFATARSFRAGGWQANNAVLEALADEGFTLDSSATHAPYLQEAWGAYNLVNFVAKLWPHTAPESQPYVHETHRGGALWELPNNGCLADYMTASQMKTAFAKQIALLRQDPNRDVYLSIGFHQETAQDWLSRLRTGLVQIESLAKAEKVAIEYVVGPWPKP